MPEIQVSIEVNRIEVTMDRPLKVMYVVEDLTERNAIPASVRYDGFIAYVITDKSTWQLQGGISNGDWDAIAGVPGKSAYEVAVDNGFVGTEAERLTSLEYDPSVLGYEHTQASASTTRTIPHNLGYRPNITCVDTIGNIMFGIPTRTSINSLTIAFSSSVSGVAYLS